MRFLRHRAELDLEILFVTKWMPDEQGGGTQQRAAANLRALATCGRVHLLNLGSDSRALPPGMAALTSSVYNLSDIKNRLGRPLRYGTRKAWSDRLLHTAWGMSGLISKLNIEESTAIADWLGRGRFDGAFAFHLGSALVVDALPVLKPDACRVIDWDFLESPNVLASALAQSPVLGWRRAAAVRFNQFKVRRWESDILNRWDSHLCSSSQDLAFLRARANQDAVVFSANNSVHVDAQCPPPPSDKRPPTVVFVGTMAYWPNVDAVQHFLSEIWPLVRRAIPLAEFQVVGRAVPADLLARSGCDGLMVYNDVPSVAPHYAQSHVSVVPLRFAVGSNLKVPEAMAYGRPVVGYRQACERHALGPDAGVFSVDSPIQLADTLISLLQDPRRSAMLGEQAHRAAFEHLSDDVTHRILTAVLSNIYGR